MNTDPDIEHDENGITDRLVGDENPEEVVSATQTETPSSPYERWSKLPRARGRQPRDPQGQFVKFQCRDIDEMEAHLRDYLEAPIVPAEHATIEFVFPASAAFMVYAADFKTSRKTAPEIDRQQHLYGRLDRTAISVINALAPTEDPKDQMRRQKAISKVCVEACEKADGFRYSFHNNWLSREDEACRFSYFCNDSTLNKGRAANEGAGTQGKKMRKPVYNCQGLIAVKFSATKQNLELHYKHIPLHKTYAERAPPPRRDSKRRKIMEVFSPEALPVDRRKTKTMNGIVDNTFKKSRKQRTNDSVNENTQRQDAIDTDRENNFQPLVEYLGSTGTIGHELEIHDTNTTPRRNTASASIESPTMESVHPVTTKTAATTRSHRPAIPGTMAGSVRNGHLDWSVKTTPDRQAQSSGARKSSSKSQSVLVNAETMSAATAGTANVALSELEALKQKLEEAEARIKRLEAEKGISHPAALTGPPQHMLWPPPPEYVPPTHPSYPFQPPALAYQPPQHQPASPSRMRFQPPPQRPYSTVHPNQNNTTQAAVSTTTHDPSPNTPTSVARKTGKRKPAATKFVLYTPPTKSKQPVEPAQMISTAPSANTSTSAITHSLQNGIERSTASEDDIEVISVR